MFDLPLLQWSAKVRSGPGQWLAEVVATAGLLLVINGSPYESDKDDVRLELCARRARERLPHGLFSGGLAGGRRRTQLPRWLGHGLGVGWYRKYWRGLDPLGVRAACRRTRYGARSLGWRCRLHGGRGHGEGRRLDGTEHARRWLRHVERRPTACAAASWRCE